MTRSVPPIPAAHLEALIPSQDRSERRDYGSDLAFRIWTYGMSAIGIVGTLFWAVAR